MRRYMLLPTAGPEILPASGILISNANYFISLKSCFLLKIVITSTVTLDNRNSRSHALGEVASGSLVGRS